jgi:hypothetical protein
MQYKLRTFTTALVAGLLALSAGTKAPKLIDGQSPLLPTARRFAEKKHRI